MITYGCMRDRRPLEFPIQVAALDIGSNALRLIAAEFATPTDWVRLAYERAPVRLGQDAFSTGMLSVSAMDRAVEALRRFRLRIDELGVEHVRAVATSAVRETDNGPAFVARVLEETGFQLHLISGGEEAHLVWRAVKNRIDFGDQKWMMVDLGGGSVEVSLADQVGIMWSESHTMGSVRLVEELSGASDKPAHFAGLLAEYAATLRIPGASRHWTPVGLIATGGNIEALARMANEPSDEDRVLQVTRDQLRATIETLSQLSVDQRIEQLGLREDRADVILPAAVVYDRVAELAGAERILVPEVGVKEGVLLDLVDELTSEAGFERAERVAYEASLTLGRRYLFDENHGRHVAKLALSLFDQLRGVHELAEEDRRILLAGALLHDIGQHISYRKHHKHSHYLLLHSEIAGISPDELPLVALLARYHRRAEPSEGHLPFGELTEPNRRRVERLSALLRLADSLDREHLQRVRGVEARVHEDRLELHLEKDGPILLEQWALEKKGKLFAKLFGLHPFVTFDLSKEATAQGH